MYQAKSAGRNRVCFFDPQMQATVNARLAMETDIRQALLSESFALHYQPQVDQLGKVLGAEALLRWPLRDGGFVSPMDFIPVAETTGLILPISKWVLRSACETLFSWSLQPATANLTLAVNISAIEMHQDDFVDQVLGSLKRSGAPAHRLKLELTESLLVKNMVSVKEKMLRLKAHGVGFALDDFGTGYSSLSYLKLLPLDQLKIDKSFVRDVLSDPNDASIARTIVSLGQGLNLAVIAEGVETAAQREFLAGIGCINFQGYHCGRPMPLNDFNQWISENTIDFASG